jgi:lysophospholipase L1-like esterase
MKKLKNIFINLGLIFLSLGFCFVILEFGFRLAGYEAIYDVYSKPSLFWRSDPLLGWSHEPNSEDTYIGPRPWPVEFSTKIKINSLGLRNPEITDKPKNGIRILFTGDSRVAALEVKYEQTFVALLEDLLTKQLGIPVQVINAGVRGYGTDQSYLYYKERGYKLKPDFVVHLHTGNDPLNNITLHRMRRPFGKPVFRPNADGKLELTGYPTPHYKLCSEYELDDNFEVVRLDSPFRTAVCNLQIQATDHSALFTYVILKLTQHRELLWKFYLAGSPKGIMIPDDGSQARYQITTQLLRQFAKTVKENDTKFVFMSDGDHQLANLDREALKKDQISLIEIDSLVKEGEKLDGFILFQNDGHWTPLGHQRLAAFLVPKLVDIIKSK